MRLVGDKPSLYITFEQVNNPTPTSTRLASASGTSEQPHHERRKNEKVIWLRLHNNTRWAINFPTDSLYLGTAISPIKLCDGRPVLGLRNGIKIDIRYELDFARTRQKAISELPSLNRSDVFSASWLPSGGSILFSVPREELIDDLMVYVPFKYEWEYGERAFRTDEPEHRICFRASDLPKNIQRVYD